ncbi:unnamed protein product [Protopolystoma xenopodis]|uniref:Uncharacterized protein n=1 Tax=Protopolystoma xenopodis TaxID=117903 RepID=A0A3S5A677_9PLAT|nr:unnamed protein product [Protopolystoma xenopodis]
MHVGPSPDRLLYTQTHKQADTLSLFQITPPSDRSRGTNAPNNSPLSRSMQEHPQHQHQCSLSRDARSLGLSFAGSAGVGPTSAPHLTTYEAQSGCAKKPNPSTEFWAKMCHSLLFSALIKPIGHSRLGDSAQACGLDITERPDRQALYFGPLAAICNQDPLPYPSVASSMCKVVRDLAGRPSHEIQHF